MQDKKSMILDRIKKIMATIFVSVFAVGIFVVLYLQLPMFGKLAQGERLARIEKSPNYKNGRFYNLQETPLISGNILQTLIKVFTKGNRGRYPRSKLPTIKTNLKNLNPKEDVLVWFGHSSYFIQLDGKHILVDPLFSAVSSPILFYPRVFNGTDLYQSDDMPEIDYLIITHDHWDHLDYQTILRLKPKVKKNVCPLGVGAHLEYWDFSKEQIIEMDWNEDVSIAEDFTIHCLPACHFSGRGFTRNKSLWASFLLKTRTFKLYIGGDSGYGKHYTEIGNRFGPIELAILDSGQHDKNWKYVHLMTDEVLKASRDLHAKALLPVHICKISLAYHPWNEPLIELSEMIREEKFSLLTPIIGEKVKLRSPNQATNRWWKNLE